MGYAAGILQFIVYFFLVVRRFEQQIFTDSKDNGYGYNSNQGVDHIKMLHDHLSGNGKHKYLKQIFCGMFCKHLYKLHSNDQSQDIAQKFIELTGLYAEQGMLMKL